MPIAIHPQNRVPHWVVDDITDVVREFQLDGEDLHDITVSVAAGEGDYVGAGFILWAFLRTVTEQFDVSAQFLISEACIALGWPVSA